MNYLNQGETVNCKKGLVNLECVFGSLHQGVTLGNILAADRRKSPYYGSLKLFPS